MHGFTIEKKKLSSALANPIHRFDEDNQLYICVLFCFVCCMIVVLSFRFFVFDGRRKISGTEFGYFDFEFCVLMLMRNRHRHKN